MRKSSRILRLKVSSSRSSNSQSGSKNTITEGNRNSSKPGDRFSRQNSKNPNNKRNSISAIDVVNMNPNGAKFSCQNSNGILKTRSQLKSCTSDYVSDYEENFEEEARVSLTFKEDQITVD